MMNAMYTRPDATYEYDAPECTTGNCKYPSFGSLAVCSKSHDITDRLYTMATPQKWCYQQVEDKWDLRTWGPDICSNYSYAALSPTIYLDYFSSGILANTSNVWLNSNDTWEGVFSFERDVFADNALNAVHTIYLDSSDSSWNSYLGGLPDTSQYLQHAHAVETLLYLCAQEFTVSTTNGTTSTDVISTLDYVTDIEVFESSPDGYHYTTEYNRIFTLNGHDYSYVMVDEILGQMMMSSLEGKYNNNTYAGMPYMTPFSFATGNVLYHNPNIDGNMASKRNTQMQNALETMMSNMAKGMTNWFVSQKILISEVVTNIFYRLRSTGSPVQGQAEVLTEFVVVQWHFLFPLGLQITLSICFMVWAMVVSKAQKARILKDSPLTTSFPVTKSDKVLLEEELAREDEENNQIREDVERLPIEKFGRD